VLAGENLDRQHQQVHLRLAPGQHLFQPLPLGLAEHGAIRVDRIPEVTRVEQDHPDHLTGRAIILNAIHPLLLPPRTVFSDI
jgi:hypothetical protein